MAETHAWTIPEIRTSVLIRWLTIPVWPGPGVAAHLDSNLACVTAYPDAGMGESGIRILRPSCPYGSAVNEQDDIADRAGSRGSENVPQQRW